MPEAAKPGGLGTRTLLGRRHYLGPRTGQFPRGQITQPFMTMAEVNGYLVDLRDMLRKVQEIAFEKGMIPYIADDRG